MKHLKIMRNPEPEFLEDTTVSEPSWRPSLPWAGREREGESESERACGCLFFLRVVLAPADCRQALSYRFPPPFPPNHLPNRHHTQCRPFPGQLGGPDDDDNNPLGSPHSPSSPSFRSPPIRTPTSSESELLCLDPPYLVPRPKDFPTPTLLVEVVSAHNLKVNRPAGVGERERDLVCVCLSLVGVPPPGCV